MSNVAPVVTEVTFDQASYAPGALITVTIRYTPGASESTSNFTGTATDKVTGLAGAMTGTFTVQSADPTQTEGADDGNRVWAPVSDDGAVAVFTSTA